MSAPHWALSLVALSAILQIAAALMAVRIARRTHRSFAWGLIAAALFLMVARRGVTLVRLATDPAPQVDAVAEAIALAISVLMLSGVVAVAPTFRWLRDAAGREEQLGRIFEASHHEIYVIDATTLRFLQVNRGARENLGYSMEELRELTPLDLKPAFDRERFEALIAPLRRGERQSVRFATHHRRKDGSTYPVEVNLQLSREGGAPVLVAIITDVTQRALLEAAMEQAGEGIVVADHRGRIEYANPAFSQMMGLGGARAVGLPMAQLANGPDDEALLADMGATVARGEVWHGRYTSVWKNGSRHVRDASVAPVRGSSGALEHVIGVLRDATREEELESELRHAQKMEAVGRLAAGVAHDFNNLLTVIAGYARSLLGQSPPGSEAHAAAEQIDAAAERAAGLTRQLLTFGRKAPTRPVPFDPAGRVARMSGMLARLIGEDVELELALEPGVGWILADPAAIEQALLNLAANARDAMPGGGRLTISAREERMGPWDASEVERGRWIVLTVADTGTGMDPETLGRAFDPFFTTKEPGRGTGLGLSAVYGTVRAAKGRVRVQSAPGGGSVFELWFPRVEPAAPARAEPQNLLERSGGGETILLVEDEPLVRRLVKQTLERRGYRVVDARDPREALETAASHRVDVLITDVVMPHMSGLELADRLRRERPELRVVTMSGYAEELDGRSADAARREVFLPKPFGPEDLARAVRRALSER